MMNDFCDDKVRLFPRNNHECVGRFGRLSCHLAIGDWALTRTGLVFFWTVIICVLLFYLTNESPKIHSFSFLVVVNEHRDSLGQRQCQRHPREKTRSKTQD